MRDYGNPSYWDERYAAYESSRFEWYQDFQGLKQHIDSYISAGEDFEVLIPGCGNSRLGADLYEHGVKNITCVDTSAVVISQMSDRYLDLEDMEYSVMDARNLDLPDKCFDLVFDKALMDALLCGRNNIDDVSNMVAEMHRVLKPGGRYVVVSHGSPATRIGYLESQQLSWAVQHREIKKQPLPSDAESPDSTESHFIYICTKARP